MPNAPRQETESCASCGFPLRGSHCEVCGKAREPVHGEDGFRRGTSGDGDGAGLERAVEALRNRDLTRFVGHVVAADGGSSVRAVAANDGPGWIATIADALIFVSIHTPSSEVVLEAPVVRLRMSPRVPAMRLALELSTNDFATTRFSLRDELLVLRYSARLAVLTPIALRQLLRELAVMTNRYIDLFGAAFDAPPAIAADQRQIVSFEALGHARKLRHGQETVREIPRPSERQPAAWTPAAQAAAAGPPSAPMPAPPPVASEARGAASARSETRRLESPPAKRPPPPPRPREEEAPASSRAPDSIPPVLSMFSAPAPGSAQKMTPMPGHGLHAPVTITAAPHSVRTAATAPAIPVASSRKPALPPNFAPPMPGQTSGTSTPIAHNPVTIAQAPVSVRTAVTAQAIPVAHSASNPIMPHMPAVPPMQNPPFAAPVDERIRGAATIPARRSATAGPNSIGVMAPVSRLGPIADMELDGVGAAGAGTQEMQPADRLWALLRQTETFATGLLKTNSAAVVWLMRSTAFRAVHAHHLGLPDASAHLYRGILTATDTDSSLAVIQRIMAARGQMPPEDALVIEPFTTASQAREQIGRHIAEIDRWQGDASLRHFLALGALTELLVRAKLPQQVEQRLKDIVAHGEREGAKSAAIDLMMTALQRIVAG